MKTYHLTLSVTWAGPEDYQSAQDAARLFLAKFAAGPLPHQTAEVQLELIDLYDITHEPEILIGEW